MIYRTSKLQDSHKFFTKFSTENLFRKKITYDSATWKECNTKKVPHGNRKT